MRNRLANAAIGAGGVLAGLAALFVFAGGFARGVRPDVSAPPPAYTADELAEVEESRRLDWDPDALPTFHVAVDHSEGETAAWYPRGESPVLAGLVREGLLPPVHERVGPEPVVLRGVDGIGNYGGTWLRAATSASDIGIISWRLSAASLVRWSPMAYPIEPHLARSVEMLDGGREHLITLREGLRWSDGHPLTTDDILYWWEHEVNEPEVWGYVPEWMTVEGEPGRFEKVDDLRLRVTFPKPHGLFLEFLAQVSHGMVTSPVHYLRQYHPVIGDDDVAEAAMRAYRLPSRRALYSYVKGWDNPEHPRMWPWVYRTYRSNPPHAFVRNPYYPVVDEEGNQLPYVDRIQFDVLAGEMLGLAAANGEVTMQVRHIRYADYTELMSRRERSGIRILHWYPADRSDWLINPNINRAVEPGRPETAHKARLLGDKRFRQAMSLAINRADIIRAHYNNQSRPAQVAPGPLSFFHHEEVEQAFIEYDPERANAKLDELGLTNRDYEGYRTFPDGSRMVFYLDYCSMTGFGPAQFVVDDWGAVGIRTVPRERSRELFYAEKNSQTFDFNVWTGASDFLPLVSPRHFVAHNSECFYAHEWGRWYMMGGMHGSRRARESRAEGPPRDHPMFRAMLIYEEARQAPTLEQQQRLAKEIMDIAAEQLWTINLAEAPPALAVVDANLRNVPDLALAGHIFSTPANAGIETYYFEEPRDSPGAIADLRQAVLEVSPRPGATATPRDRTWGRLLGRVIRYGFLGVLVLGLALVSVGHPFILRRILIMIPTLLVISVVVFTIIQLPPGDYLALRLLELETAGDESALQIIEELRSLFHFDEPVVQRYLRWMGVYWFAGFDPSDAGLLQGSLGRSMETTQPVNQMVGDRILLTVLISVGTILFTWALAIPVGIFSAVRQYSVYDYILTFIAFIGVCVPPFLLALVLMAAAGVSGLFSPEYAAQPEWTAGKVLDLLKHVWIPVVVLGVGGTAGMIRVMRANLLDELRKPYVTTARAKGVRPVKLLFKYPVRMALNPFISGIGTLFPQLVSGGAIVAMVLSLPTVGPLLLSALFSQDMYLAGSMLMVLSLLGVFGTLVSDLLLLWLDPRIRFQGGTR